MVIVMIKVIAFDLVGVLVREKDFPLNEIETKIERLFGPNKNDEEFLNNIKENIYDVSRDEIIKIIEGIIQSIYDTKLSLEELSEFKKVYHNIQLVVATNHVSFIQDFILSTFPNVFDKIYISANMNKIKPDKEFYLHILKDLNISEDELLFLDDSIKNVQGAKECGITTIRITKETNILEEIKRYI